MPPCQDRIGQGGDRSRTSTRGEAGAESQGGTMKRISIDIAVALAVACGTEGWPQPNVTMRLAYFVGDQHAMSQWLIKWSDNLEQQSGGLLTVKRFPGSQMGSVQQPYDLARTGQADVVWFVLCATPE